MKFSKNNSKNQITNGDIPFLSDINVAVIMDAFTYNSFSPEFNTFVLEPDTWQEVFENNRIDIFFCESSWRGVGRESIIEGNAIENDYAPWGGKIAVKLDKGTGREKTLLQIIEHCKNNDIPTIFWNKEDPPSFDRFIDMALNFDYVFTTDEDCIKKYKFRGHENVFPLLFASQIRMFNPIQTKQRTDKVIFAGSWPSKYKDRCADMHNIFRKVLKSGRELKIYNRNSEKDDPQFFYPEEYDRYVYPKVEHYQIPSVYKEGKMEININTIQKSKTMFARRVFELMSSNTFVLSNYSEGVYDLFGDNVLYLNKEDSLEVDDEYIAKICEENLYNVLENHTYTDRFKYILDCINFDYREKINRINVFYFPDENTSLDDIINDFNAIDYYYKYCKIVNAKKQEKPDLTGIDSDTVEILEYEDLNGYSKKLDEDDYCVFRDLNEKIDEKFIEKARLHYKYIEKEYPIISSEEKYSFGDSTKSKNVFFNSVNYDKYLENINEGKENSFIVYKI